MLGHFVDLQASAAEAHVPLSRAKLCWQQQLKCIPWFLLVRLLDKIYVFHAPTFDNTCS